MKTVGLQLRVQSSDAGVLNFIKSEVGANVLPKIFGIDSSEFGTR